MLAERRCLNFKVKKIMVLNHKVGIISEPERIMNRLESDKMGVIADVLLKHGKIKCVDEIYKRVCDT